MIGVIHKFSFQFIFFFKKKSNPRHEPDYMEITVDNPHKVTDPSESYTVYDITTKVRVHNLL